MNTITQTMRFRQVLIEYSFKHGVTKAAIRYKVNRQYVYRWRKRYDGTLASLADKSHKPHHHPNQHTADELKLITDMRRRNPNAGLVVFWVKFVPEACIVGEANGKKFYQYTAIDEYSRFRYLEAFEEHSSYSSAVFLEHLVKAFKFPIECVQTDNGQEFTKRLGSSQKPTLTMFEKRLKELGIQHKLIRPYTPRHNGKVERSHRKDNEYFYATHKFYSFDDFAKQLKVHNRNYNKFPMRPLNWKAPIDYINSFINFGELF